MGVTVRETTKSRTSNPSAPDAPGSDESGSNESSSRWRPSRGSSARAVLVVGSALASVAVVVSLVAIGLQAHPPPRSQTPASQPAYTSRPTAVVNGHVWLQGATGWKDVTPAAFGNDDPVDAQFLSASLGWTADVELSDTSTKDVVVYRTSDEGATWKRVTVPWEDEGLANLVQLQFVDSQHGFIMVGLGEAASRRPGFLFTTGDGGATWSKLAVPSGGAIRFSSPDDGWLIGGGVNYARNLLWVTRDGGHTWQDLPLAAPQGLELNDRHIGTPAVSSTGAPDSGAVLAANFGSSLGFYTYSGATNLWTLGPTFPVAGADREALPIVALTDQTGLAVVGSALYTSHDGGASWSSLSHSANLTRVQWLGVSGPATGWAVVAGRGFCQAPYLTRCNNETLLTTADGGASWAPA